MKRIVIALLLTAGTTVSPFLNTASAEEAKHASTPVAQPNAGTNWSKPVRDLRGRLVVAFEDLQPGVRHRVFLELENVSGGFVPVTISMEGVTPSVTSQLFDEAGKVMPKVYLPMSGPVLSSQNAVIPPLGYIGFRIDKLTVGVPPRGRGAALLAMPGEGEWMLRPGKYLLKSTVSINKVDGADARQWFGQLELPSVEVTVSQKDVDATAK